MLVIHNGRFVILLSGNDSVRELYEFASEISLPIIKINRLRAQH